MSHRCSKCGRFNKRMRDVIGMPLTTGFPPDKPNIAATFPFAPFICRNHDGGTLYRTLCGDLERLSDFGYVESEVDGR